MIQNSYALITGASTGIGKELAYRFAQDGIPVILVSRSKGKLDGVAKEVEDRFQVSAEVLAMDLAQPQSARALDDVIKSKGLQVSHLVNNAGFGIYGKFVEQEIGDVSRMLQLNLVTLTELTHIYAQSFVRSGGGGIMNVASIAGFMPTPYSSCYGASKAYVLCFSESINAELRGTGVHVTAVCPGATETEFFDRANINVAKLKNVMMSAEAVASEGYKAYKEKKPLVITGGMNKAMVGINRLFPREWSTRAMKKFVEKNMQ